jgi:hypothetical protein
VGKIRLATVWQKPLYFKTTAKLPFYGPNFKNYCQPVTRPARYCQPIEDTTVISVALDYLIRLFWQFGSSFEVSQTANLYIANLSRLGRVLINAQIAAPLWLSKK